MRIHERLPDEATISGPQFPSSAVLSTWQDVHRAEVGGTEVGPAVSYTPKCIPGMWDDMSPSPTSRCFAVPHRNEHNGHPTHGQQGSTDPHRLWNISRDRWVDGRPAHLRAAEVYKELRCKRLLHGWRYGMMFVFQRRTNELTANLDSPAGGDGPHSLRSTSRCW